MSALDTFDWYNSQAWEAVEQKALDFIKKQRKYLMSLKSEDERKRFVSQYIKEVGARNGRDSSETQGG